MNRAEMPDRRILLSYLWIFVTVNYIFCDVVSLMDPNMLRSLIETGGVGSMALTEGFLLGAGVMMEIPFIMILLSRFLKLPANRIANIIAGSLMTLIQIASLLVDDNTMHYLFFSAVEIATTISVVVLAIRWKKGMAVVD